ncbi:MAG: SGNH/GDSL hydrolase family protein [Isosphaeraceae bacterium]|nr:SGNH/GDSL hydrolase family protein [Isosphaeraceae bacterium]
METIPNRDAQLRAPRPCVTGQGRAIAVCGLLALLASTMTRTASAAEAKIVTLGDSITKGVRQGVGAEETFAALLGARLKERRVAAEVINVGIGGERTDQALARLEQAVLSRRPKVVTVMYGTNDSYVDQGTKASRIDVETYRKNLTTLVDRLRERGAEPILMTPPRWADDASPNGLGENPNARLEPYVNACRDVARTSRVALVDHFADWTGAARRGINLRDWTTDGCHPNPEGHRRMAELLLPAVLRLVAPQECGHA